MDQIPADSDHITLKPTSNDDILFSKELGYSYRQS